MRFDIRQEKQHLFKVNSIKTLLHRAFATCSTWKDFYDEIAYLTSYFCMNKYPRKLVTTHINHFLNRMRNPLSKPINVPKNQVYIKLQYLGPLSFHLRRNLRKLLTPCYPQTDLRFIFTNNNTIKSLFPYKDRIPDHLQSNIIYQFDCVRCNSNVSYIGQTSCNLAKRIAEHKGLSERTGKKRKSETLSSIR